MYNGMLILHAPEEPTFVDFVDDLAVIVTAQYPKDMEVYAKETVISVKSWLETGRLTLVEKKTEMVLIAKRRQKNAIKMEVSEHTVF